MILASEDHLVSDRTQKHIVDQLYIKDSKEIACNNTGC